MDHNYNNQMNNINNMNSLNNSFNKRNRPHNNSGIRPQINRMAVQKQRNEDNNKFSKITAEAYHFKSKGELVLDLKTNELTWTLKGQKSDEFILKYKNNQEKITISKSNIKKLFEYNSPDERCLLRIELKNNDKIIFSFQDNYKQIMRDKFYRLLKDDYFNYYKTEFQMLPIEQQKRICLLLNNKYLILLYRKLLSCGKDIETAWKFIKYKYPEEIDVNLGKNRIQLSRDEELIMLSQRKYNITKLINSDSNIDKDYSKRKNITNENFWNDFIERQRSNNTYIVGGYKPIKTEMVEKNEEEITTNNLFEYLEKDKYYYDNYETNYLYHNEKMKNDLDNLRDKIKLLNDYSINKMKDINYFSYSSLCLNAYTNKKPIKNKNNKRYSNSSISILNDINMKEEKIEININNSKYKKKLTKEELLNRVKNMEIEYDNEKNDNNSYTTMKAINDENHKLYNLAKFEPSTIPVDNIINTCLIYIFLIKDLSLAQKWDSKSFDKFKKEEEKSLSPKRTNNEQMIKLKFKLECYNKEIRSLFETLKKKVRQKNDWGNHEQIMNFLIRLGEKTIEGN